MRRRQLLYGVTAIGAVVVSGVGSGTATAQASVDEFTVSDAHIETDSSELEELWIQRIHTHASWSGLDAPADVVDAALDVTHGGETVQNASTHQIKLSGDEYEGTVELQLPSTNLVSTFESETFEVEEGEIETFEFSFTLRMAVTDVLGHTLTSESTDEATAVVVYSEDEIVGVLDNIVITTDGTVATIFNGNDEDVCVELEWQHSGHGDETTYTFVSGGGETVQEPPGGAKGAPSYDIDPIGYELGEC